MSGARTLRVVERMHWTKPGASSVAAHCVPPAGFALTSAGFRIVDQTGAVLFPSQMPFATRDDALARLATLTA